MASCLFWGNWILQLCRKSNWIALMWWLITSLDYYAKLTAVSGLGNKWEALSLLLTCARHFYANVNGFYKSHDFPVKNEKFWRKKKRKWMLKVGRMLGVWTQEFHFSHVSCRFTFARPAYLDSISELLDSCLSRSTKDCLSSRDWYFGHETYRFRHFCQFLFGLHIRTPWFLPHLQTHHLPKLKEWQEVFTCTLRVREEVVLTTVFIFSVSKLGEVVEFQW